MDPFLYIQDTQNIQDYFDYIVKKYEEGTDDPPIRTYVEKQKTELQFRNKTGYYERNYLEVLKLK